MKTINRPLVLARMVLAALCAWMWPALCGNTATAQTTDADPVRYSVGYYADHAFLRSDSNFAVVDTRVEWPEAIDFADLRPLHTMLDSLLFSQPVADGEQAYTLFKHRLGTPVTGQLPFLPDDRRFCYVNTTVRLKTYQPRQWISLEVRQTVDPQPLSPVKRRNLYCMLTFDLQNGRVMQTDDLLRVGRLANLDQETYYAVFDQLDDDRFYDLQKADVDGAWPDGHAQTIGLHITCATSSEAFAYERQMPVRAMSHLLTRDARRMLTREEVSGQPVFTTMRPVWQGDSIYKKVDQMPAFTGGRAALANYLSSVSLFDRSQDSTAHGEAIVSFVVDKQGQVCDVHVLSPVSPMADRHAVAIVKGMPRWQPGLLRGEAVPVRVMQKFGY